MEPRRLLRSRAGLSAAALIACTLLSACVGRATAQVPPPAAPSPSSSPSSAPAAPSAAEAALVEQPTPAPDVDWKTVSFEAAGCMSRSEWAAQGFGTTDWDAAEVHTSAADVTGDGTSEVLAQLHCPTPTSGLSDTVVVFTNVPAPQVLGLLGGGDGLFFRGATVTPADSAVTLTGPTIAGDDPQCCAGHWARATYRWSFGEFVLASKQEARTTQPIRDESLPDGEHVGIVRGVGDDEVLIDLIDWFEGAAAKRACREDGVRIEPQEWCNMYYFRNTNDLVRAMPVADAASLSYISLTSGEPVAVADVAALAGTPAISDDETGEGYSRFTVRDGRVTGLEQIFVP